MSCSRTSIEPVWDYCEFTAQTRLKLRLACDELEKAFRFFEIPPYSFTIDQFFNTFAHLPLHFGHERSSIHEETCRS